MKQYLFEIRGTSETDHGAHRYKVISSDLEKATEHAVQFGASRYRVYEVKFLSDSLIEEGQYTVHYDEWY